MPRNKKSSNIRFVLNALFLTEIDSPPSGIHCKAQEPISQVAWKERKLTLFNFLSTVNYAEAVDQSTDNPVLSDGKTPFGTQNSQLTVSILTKNPKTPVLDARSTNIKATKRPRADFKALERTHLQ